MALIRPSRAPLQSRARTKSDTVPASTSSGLAGRGLDAVGWCGVMRGRSSLSHLHRSWMAPLALRTPPQSASRANASKQAATGSWDLRRNSTNAVCVGETTRAARRSRACSPNPCKCWVAARASLSPSSAFWGGHGKAVGMVSSKPQVPVNVPVWRAEL